MKAEILLLNLMSPLIYTPDESTILGFRQEEGEKIFCFEIDESQAQKFEPDIEQFPGSLLFVGLGADKPGERIVELKEGNYIFSQVREILNREEIVELAVEVQNEGLWQRLELANRFYVRFLFEDGKGVTQIFRPYDT